MKECFIITPIGGIGSDTRRETDGLVSSVLSPVLSEFGLEPVPAHRISETGSITRQVIKRILESDLVIANLTSLNPNVMYEVGIRHCARKPMIVVAREGTVLPFDLNDERTLFFQNDMTGAEELKEQLKEMIPKALKEEAADNPVYRVVDVDLIKLPEGTPDVSILADKKFSLIEDQLEELKVTLRSLINSDQGGRYYSRKKSGALSGVISGLEYYEFSVVVDRDDDISSLKAFCDASGVSSEMEFIDKDTSKFTALCKSKREIESLKILAKKHNLKIA